MAHRLFEGKNHAALYKQYRFAPPGKVKDLILQYLDEKKGQPHALAVDLGCGTGQNTRLLAPHFHEVVGIDVSESQIEEARAVPGFPNVSYRIGKAEDLPFPDGSVDLLTASSAAHWFDQEGFLKEAQRTLKPRGCMAILGFLDQSMELQYDSCGNKLICIYEEIKKILSPYSSPLVAAVDNQFQEIFEAIPFPEKKRLDIIPVKHDVSVSDFMGFIKTFSYYQTYRERDPDAAYTLIKSSQARFLEMMGVASPETKIEVRLNYFCILACKGQ